MRKLTLLVLLAGFFGLGKAATDYAGFVSPLLGKHATI